ncbi:MAG: hypothetical protein ABH834_07935 [Candidatus Altiarchaeota archaeon]
MAGATPRRRTRDPREIRDVEGLDAQTIVDQTPQQRIDATQRQMLEVRDVAERRHVGEFSRPEREVYAPQVHRFAAKQEPALEAARSGAVPVEEVQRLFNKAQDEMEQMVRDALRMQESRTQSTGQVLEAKVVSPGGRQEAAHVVEEVVSAPAAERTVGQAALDEARGAAEADLSAAKANAEQKTPTIEAKGVRVADVEAEAEQMLAAIPAATNPQEAAMRTRDFADRMRGLGVKPEELSRIMKDKMPKTSDGKPVVSDAVLDDAITDAYKPQDTAQGADGRPNVIPFPSTGGMEALRGAGDTLSTTSRLRSKTHEEVASGVADRETRLAEETRIEAQQREQYAKAKEQLDGAQRKIKAMITPQTLEANPELRAAAEDIVAQSGVEMTDENVLKAAQTAAIMEQSVNEESIVNVTMHEAAGGMARAYNASPDEQQRKGMAGAAKALEYEALGKARAALDPDVGRQILDAHQAILAGRELTEEQRRMDLLGHDNPELLDAANYELIGRHMRKKAGEAAEIMASDEFREQGPASPRYRKFMDGIRPGQEGEVGGVNENLGMMVGDMRMRLLDDPNAFQDPGALDEIARQHLESYKNNAAYGIGDMNKRPGSWEELANAPRDEKYDIYRKLCGLNGIDAVTPEQVAVAQEKKVEDVRAQTREDYIKGEALPTTMSENYLDEAVDSYVETNRQERLEYYRNWHLMRTQERREALAANAEEGGKGDAQSSFEYAPSINRLANRVDGNTLTTQVSEDLKNQDFRKQAATVMKVQDELTRDLASQGLEVQTSDVLVAAEVFNSRNARELKSDVMTMLALKQELAIPDARDEQVLSAAEVANILGGKNDEESNVAKAA